MRPAPARGWDQETMLVAWLAACVSLLSFLYCLRRGELLLYGDAVAHINIARRVFDSLTPGLLQLGTVWLPLPHLLMIPFLLSKNLWQSGAGGSIPSMLAYVFGAVGIFRLVRGQLSPESGPDARPRVAAWVAALIYAANPNLIYLQATAMTEPLYLALFIWAVVYFAEFCRADRGSEPAWRLLRKCGACLAAACLTRYDGWFLAGVLGLAAIAMALKRGPSTPGLRGKVAEFLVISAAAPILWLAYNAVVYRNPLEFANGPYSAKAIEEKTTPKGAPAHPGSRNLPVAATFFLKSAELNLMPGNWHRLWLVSLLAGTLIVLCFQRQYWPLLLLWTPLPFYMLSIGYGGVPIFLPVWWPHSYYNVRYGIELLPAFAVMAAVVLWFVSQQFQAARVRVATVAAVVVFAGISDASVWRAQPICFREGWINSRTRIAIEGEMARTLQALPPDSTILMYLGDHVGALERAGIPLHRVIYEGNHRTWKQPSDPEGLWERALAEPQRYAQYVIASAGDAVDKGAQKAGLMPLEVIHVLGQPQVTIYRAAPATK
jgi:hypothetical protein